MKTLARLACMAAGAAMLGGCQSFPLTSWMFKGKRPHAEADTMMAANTAGSLEEGRANLRTGNLSAAIASFSVAQMDEATRAEAANGLAVAYAKLGRPDVAERYFRAAIAAAPENPKFAANLLRLQNQVMLAKQEEAPRVTAIAPAEAAPSVVASAEPLNGPVTRVSRGEVHIASRASLDAAPMMAVAYRDAPKPKVDAKVTADQVATTSSEKKDYPVTIVLGE